MSMKLHFQVFKKIQNEWISFSNALLPRIKKMAVRKSEEKKLKQRVKKQLQTQERITNHFRRLREEKYIDKRSSMLDKNTLKIRAK